MLVGEFCIRDVIIAERLASIVEIAQLMRDYHVGDIVIVDNDGPDRKPVGIVTDRDIVLELIAKELPLDSVSVGDIMGPELITVDENSDLWEALQTMRGKGIRRLPVVDRNGKLVGILSTDDLLETLADQLQDLVILIRKEQRHEEQIRK
jgi:CBS domain-containing protein